MGGINDEMKQAFVDESLEHLSSIETDLLLIEERGADIDETVVNKVFRTVHSIKGGAGFLGLTRLKELSHEMETVLGHVRSRNLVPNAEIIHFLLLASDTLEDLIHHMNDSDHIEISQHLEALRLLSHGAGQAEEMQAEKGEAEANTSGPLENEGDKGEFDGGRDTAKNHGSPPKKDPAADLPAREDLPIMEDVPQEITVCGGDGQVVFVLPLQDLARAGDEHKGVFFIEIPLKGHEADHKNTTTIIEEEIKTYGTVLGSRLDLDYLPMAGEGERGSFFLVLFASILAVDELVVLFEVDGTSILKLEGDIPGDAMDVESKRYESPMQGGPGDSEILVDDPFREPMPTLKNTDISTDDVFVNSHDFYADKASLGGGGQNHLKDVSPVLASVHAPQTRLTSAHDRGEGAAPSTCTEKKGGVSEASIRVDLTLLDTLMTLAGELVLSRNQLLQAIGAHDPHATEIVGQRINLITSELQETVMLTRMQPMGKIFDRFPRLVRDLSASLGKKVKLTIKGREVELDKTLLEAITDPLTHLIRNGVDHGIESSDVRESNGKNCEGQIFLKAFHEAGKVNIEIADDGRGLDGNTLVDRALFQGFLTTEQAGNLSSKEKLNLIFMPGFSTATEVTDLSGRGVGLDVVKSNVDSVGGQVEIESQPGIGTRFLIKVPLTLAIIPSQIILAEQERFAIPQLNLEELVRVPADQVYEKIEYVGNAQVVRLRDELLPLVRLADVIGVERTYYCHKTGQRTKDHRLKIADRRSSQNDFNCFMEDTEHQTSPAKTPLEGTKAEKRDACWTDRRYHASSALNIAVVSTGTMKYGLIVDALHDSEEIVVKPLGRHLQKCRAYAGATIMGDGRVALILDVANIADMAGILPVEVPGKRPADEEASSDEKSEAHMVQSLLTFRGAPHEPFAVPLNQVVRIEKIAASHMETLGQMRVVQNRGKTLPLFAVDEVADVTPIEFGDTFLVIVLEVGGREVGLLAASPVDAVDTHESIDEITLRQPGILGSVPINGHTTMVVDINEIVKRTSPPQTEPIETMAPPPGDVKKQGKMILVVEDSGFFRNQIKAYIEEVGYQVITAEDGQVALDLIASHVHELSLVVTDLEMPHVDGFTLTRTIKETPPYAHLPVIALSTLADDSDMAKGDAAGVDDYQIKLDRDALLKSIETHILRTKKEPR